MKAPAAPLDDRPGVQPADPRLGWPWWLWLGFAVVALLLWGLLTLAWERQLHDIATCACAAGVLPH